MATKEKERAGKLHKLSELKKFKIAKNDPDVRGWSVVGNHGERIGNVFDLIVDPESEKVRYLDVEVDRNLVNDKSNYHVLVPIGTAKLVRENDVITTPMINKEGLVHYPRYDGKPVSRDFEYELRDYLDSRHEVKREPEPKKEHKHDKDHGHYEDHKHHKDHEHHEHSEHSEHHKNISEMRKNMNEAEKEREKYHKDVKSGNELERAIAEKNIALLERDIARSERDILKLQLKNLRSGDQSDFYEHDHFNENHFYERRK